MKHAFVILMIFSAGCTIRQADAEKKLTGLYSKALAGSSAEAVAAGEAALKMMDSPVVPDVSEVQGNPFHDASEILEEGEKNFTFRAFDASMRIFEVALNKDRGNEKANAYLALLKPLRSLKGLIMRMNLSMGEMDLDTVRMGMYFYFFDSHFSVVNSFYQFTAMDTDDMTPLKTNRDMARYMSHVVANDLTAAIPYWDVLTENPHLDIILYLPQIMTSAESVRIRQADAKAAIKLYLATSLYFHGASAYNADNDPVNHDRSWAEESTQSRITRYLQDPEWGVLVEPGYYQKLHARTEELVQGSEFIVALLNQRYQDGLNTPYDFFQFNNAHFTRCPKCVQDNADLDRPPILTIWTTPERFWFRDVRPPPLESPYSPGSDEDGIWFKQSAWYRNYDGFTKRQPSVKHLKEALKLMQDVFLGPTEMKVTCKTDARNYKKTIIVDLPQYLQNPVKDAKAFHPKLVPITSEIYSVTDPTLHGLFPQGAPCYKEAREFARSKGL